MLSGILWFISCSLVGWIIGGILGDFLGGVVCFIDDILKEIPIPIELTRLVVIVGSGLAVFFFVESSIWFWLLVGWWAFYLRCVHYADEVSGGR
jgi:hypothetical protein